MVNIHPLADVQSDNIEDGTVVWQFCVILKGARIGRNCNINCMVFIENDVTIGNNVTIKPGVQLWDGIIIEDNVFIGPNVTFTNDLTPRSKLHNKEFKKTIIKKGASIGANATIVAGNIIGEYALIGAGSVVTKNIPPYHLFYGNPAIHKGYVTETGEIISMDLKDKKGNSYYYMNNKIVQKNNNLNINVKEKND
jgi:UDP-2-acetamido-3-amino-2,3-dideoxy-glucuronate N-acetyltransferase